MIYQVSQNHFFRAKNKKNQMSDCRRINTNNNQFIKISELLLLLKEIQRIHKKVIHNRVI
jgi:hypothetical protein